MVHAHDGLVQAKGRGGNDDLVVRLEHRHERGVQGLGGAVGNDDVLGRIRKSLLTHVVANFEAQRECAVVGRVVRHAAA